jgi:hypothetical protein
VAAAESKNAHDGANLRARQTTGNIQAKLKWRSRNPPIARMRLYRNLWRITEAPKESGETIYSKTENGK